MRHYFLAKSEPRVYKKPLHSISVEAFPLRLKCVANIALELETQLI